MLAGLSCLIKFYEDTKEKFPGMDFFSLSSHISGYWASI